MPRALGRVLSGAARGTLAPLAWYGLQFETLNEEANALDRLSLQPLPGCLAGARVEPDDLAVSAVRVRERRDGRGQDAPVARGVGQPEATATEAPSGATATALHQLPHRCHRASPVSASSSAVPLPRHTARLRLSGVKATPETYEPRRLRQNTWAVHASSNATSSQPSRHAHPCTATARRPPSGEKATASSVAGPATNGDELAPPGLTASPRVHDEQRCGAAIAFPRNAAVGGGGHSVAALCNGDPTDEALLRPAPELPSRARVEQGKAVALRIKTVGVPAHPGSQ
eukprot:CAMPEP_0179200216 /NCGR_PEP_ID=MMETSP0796-20121207/99641_1 /TAXON_ID=73915 /ORGANISM="Pyrodinium bahamense, Strain pbaha01" /LENGTH=285 /DNA_ID=CAMNT_0020904771 /DNA_START=205 /DNA_END=1060 /DNA_ORIENTATION=-